MTGDIPHIGGVTSYIYTGFECVGIYTGFECVGIYSIIINWDRLGRVCW